MDCFFWWRASLHGLKAIREKQDLSLFSSQVGNRCWSLSAGGSLDQGVLTEAFVSHKGCAIWDPSYPDSGKCPQVLRSNRLLTHCILDLPVSPEIKFVFPNINGLLKKHNACLKGHWRCSKWTYCLHHSW